MGPIWKSFVEYELAFQLVFYTYINHISHILPLWKKRRLRNKNSCKITVCFCLRGFDSYQRRGAIGVPRCFCGFHLGEPWRIFCRWLWNTGNPKKCSLCSWGDLRVASIYTFFGDVTCFLFSTFLKMCHSRNVPCVTCPRKSRWNLQESGNPEPWKASDTKPEGKVFVKHGSELRLCWLARKTNLLPLFEFDCVLPPFCSYRFFRTLKVIQVRCSAAFVHMFICYIHIHIVRCSADVYLLHSYLVEFTFCAMRSCIYTSSSFTLTVDFLQPAMCTLLNVCAERMIKFWLLSETIDGNWQLFF